MKISFTYRTIRSYIGCLLQKIIFRSIAVEGKTNIPPEGTATLVVSNHQNTLCDPLILITTLTNRKPYLFARADIFNKSKWQSKILTHWGLLPAYRMNQDGFDKVENNYTVFETSESLLCKGKTVVIFPEGKHQGRHVLGDFSTAYLRMAFDAAARNEFKKEITIVPTGFHYDKYLGLRNRAMVHYGEPIYLSKWYESYRKKPRTTCHEVNNLVQEKIQNIILNLGDDEDYDTKDFLRCTYCYWKRAPYVNSLADTLTADKQFFQSLETLPIKERTVLLTTTANYHKALQQKGLADESLQRNWSLGGTLGMMLLTLVMLPLWIISLWPGIIPWIVGKYNAAKMGDPLFQNAFLLGLGGMVLMPLLCIATTVTMGFTLNWGVAVLWLLLQPMCVLFSWHQSRFMLRIRNSLRLCHLHHNERKKILSMREVLYNLIDHTLSIRGNNINRKL